jgi:ACS family D-galactonate transporter-like MFS transporter
VITKGSFIIPLNVAGVLALLGVVCYLFVVGRIEPLAADRSVSDRR